MGPINGWHNGERAIQHKMGYDDVMSQAWSWIEPEMPEEHQVFYTTRLPFIPVATIDDRQRPWSCILAGIDGKPGFATSQHLGELTLNAHVWEGDPFPHNVTQSSGRPGPVLIAGIGIEFSTRRRNKFAGYIDALENDGSAFHVRSVVNEAIGNCPKYINVRDLVSTSDTHPHVVYRCLDLSPQERLPDDVISFIHASDTLFLGTYYDAGEPDQRLQSHVGMNQRGGKPGFARVRPSDGRTLVIPDYSGNRLLTSLGNIEVTPLAGVSFVSFVTGAVLYLTGEAHNLVGSAAQRLMPRTNALTTIRVTGYILVEDALPVRQKPGTEVQRSPYSPPVRLLAEEVTSTFFVDDLQETPTVTLARIELHSPDIAAFTFESPTRVYVVPGQAAILDFKSFVGALSYQHMAPDNPTSVNDDRVRTWTVSGSSLWADSPSENANANAGTHPMSLTLTIRHKPGGAVTSALFTMVQQMVKFRPELLEDARPLQLSVPLVGIVGDFTLATEADTCAHKEGAGASAQQGSRKWLWVAGGIGVTPFLAMLAGLREKRSRRGSGSGDADDIILVIATREPDVLLSLINRALEHTDNRLQDHEAHHGTLSIYIFSRSPACLSSVTTAGRSVLGVEVAHHPGRLNKDTLCALNIKDVQEREVYVCGPDSFEQVVLGALKDMGVDSCKIKREGFVY